MQAWVLDTLPGDVRAGGPGRADHPADLIETLRRLPLPITDRHAVIDFLTHKGELCSVPCYGANGSHSCTDGCVWTLSYGC